MTPSTNPSLSQLFAREGLSPRTTALFREFVYRHYRCHRRPLPWRETTDPYRVLVSEVMLQQTRVERVVEKYPEFLAAFPDLPALAAAPLPAVLAVWQGMGYNRRAVALQRCAREAVEHWGGTLPADPAELQRLPGIGPYTAAAVAAFAFNCPTVVIETNIRAVFLHHFCADREGVPDRELLPLVAATLDRDNPREWYNALMDYGTMLKKEHANPARRSAHHSRQSPFAGSDRQLRGQILRTLLEQGPLPAGKLTAAVGKEPERVERILVGLVREGFVVRRGRRVALAEGD
jgi:A/G-specific adenine glycosylase